MQINKIYDQDCVVGMKQLESDSVDIIIADPPYNIGKDFGNNKDNKALPDYLKWCNEWILEAFRVLKPTGTMYIYGFSEILARISNLIDIDHQRWLIWHYTNKNVPSLNFWQRSHESIIVCWKGKPLFNRDDVREPYTENFLKNAAGRVRNGTQGRFGKAGQKTIYNAHKNGALPRDVIDISTLAGGASLKERGIFCKTCNKLIVPKERHIHANHNVIIHPTQKPLDLTSRLIKAARPIGEYLVLIPFVGSGSECLATIQNSGNFLGFEINPDYITLANAQIKELLSQPKLRF